MQIRFLITTLAFLLLSGCSNWKDGAFKNDFADVDKTQKPAQTYVVGELSSEDWTLLVNSYWAVSKSAFKEGLEKALRADNLYPSDTETPYYKIDVVLKYAPSKSLPWEEFTTTLSADYHVYSISDNKTLINQHIETTKTAPPLYNGSVWQAFLLGTPAQTSDRPIVTSHDATHDNIVQFVKSLNKPIAVQSAY